MLEAEAQVVAQRASGGAEVVVDHVSKRFGRVVAVSEASLRLEPGEFVALNGPSGCGKSTLLNMIGSLALPDSGTIAVDGQSIASVDSTARATAGPPSASCSSSTTCSRCSPPVATWRCR